MAVLLVFTLVSSNFTSALFATEFEENASVTSSYNEPGDPGGDNESSANAEEDSSMEGGVETNVSGEEGREDQDNQLNYKDSEYPPPPPHPRGTKKKNKKNIK